MATRCVSLDGDADRLVYFSLTDGAAMQLFDGDKIAALVASYICELLRALPHCELRKASVRGLVRLEEPGCMHRGVPQPHAWWCPQVGVVQTAYANGASTRYLTNTLRLRVVTTATGVKHLHKAAEEFDVGVYFEANGASHVGGALSSTCARNRFPLMLCARCAGHGTVLFKEGFAAKLDYACEAMEDISGGWAVSKLRALGQVFNQAVGDALSGVLVIEAILK
jgi:phosphoacetylglucosamine mutase